MICLCPLLTFYLLQKLERVMSRCEQAALRKLFSKINVRGSFFMSKDEEGASRGVGSEHAALGDQE